ncbi:hypothetical protein PC9H_001745 [Pleurotus ostreatus]|uniref:Uncharacterized protein n=1 Tax=Pleurotus ostreatus TaxID=5322 RepID=A0A8H7DY28_PLEOS|nr:uncharacterized protein PC9H_001745 [Pleurotus ostreatus]KAF7441395.1 hypothetical protein PC9H_001745 [Pleurotus ostreatus]
MYICPDQTEHRRHPLIRASITQLLPLHLPLQESPGHRYTSKAMLFRMAQGRRVFFYVHGYWRYGILVAYFRDSMIGHIHHTTHALINTSLSKIRLQDTHTPLAASLRCPPFALLDASGGVAVRAGGLGGATTRIRAPMPRVVLRRAMLLRRSASFVRAWRSQTWAAFRTLISGLSCDGMLMRAGSPPPSSSSSSSSVMCYAGPDTLGEIAMINLPPS